MSVTAMQSRREPTDLMVPEEIFGTRRVKPKWWERPIQACCASLEGLYRREMGERYANVMLLWLILDIIYWGIEPITGALFWCLRQAWTSSGDAYRVAAGEPPVHFWVNHEGLKPSGPFEYFMMLSLCGLFARKLAAIGRNLRKNRTYSHYSGKPWIAWICVPLGNREHVVKRFFEPTLWILGGYTFRCVDLFLGTYVMLVGGLMLLKGYLEHERQRAFLFDMVDGQIEGQQLAHRMEQERGNSVDGERSRVESAVLLAGEAPTVPQCYAKLGPTLTKLLDAVPNRTSEQGEEDEQEQPQTPRNHTLESSEQAPGFEHLDPALQELCSETDGVPKSNRAQPAPQSRARTRTCPKCGGAVPMEQATKGVVRCPQCRIRLRLPTGRQGRKE